MIQSVAKDFHLPEGLGNSRAREKAGFLYVLQVLCSSADGPLPRPQMS